MFTKLEEKYDYSDVLIVPNDSDIKSRSEVNLHREFKFKWSNQTKYGVPIIAANMDTVGTLKMGDALAQHGVFTALHKHYSPAEILHAFKREDRYFNFDDMTCSPIRNDFNFYTMGVRPEDLKQFGIMALNSRAPDMVCIDIANGHLNIILEVITTVRKLQPNAVIMAGNVVTADRAVKIIEAGADIVKVGIGPGSVCTTRKQTGVGYPQLSAVYECAAAVDAIGGLVCADGGCTVPGDVAKALIAGADFVMLGGMLAGTDESGGQVIVDSVLGSDGVEVLLGTAKMLFYGMSSTTAMDKHSGGMAKYRSSEGRSLLVPYKGSVEVVIEDILGGLRSAMTYVGCTDVKDLAHSAKFVKTRHQLNTVFEK